jgi:hypothetical protein
MPGICPPAACQPNHLPTALPCQRHVPPEEHSTGGAHLEATLACLSQEVVKPPQHALTQLPWLKQHRVSGRHAVCPAGSGAAKRGEGKEHMR